MCNGNTNTTTSTTSLPAGLTAGVNSAASSAINAFNQGNPFAGQANPVAPINQWQTNAANTFNNVSGYNPQQVSTGYQAQQVSTGPVTGDQIANYTNPYTSQVIGTSLDQLNRQLQQTNAISDGQAAQAGAFGGDRAAIVNTENARNANQIAAQTIAGLNSQGYSQALSAAQQDQARQLQAGESNQYAGLQAANLDATQQRANQAAGLQGAGLNLQAAGQEGNIGSQFRGYSQDQLNSIYNQQRSDAYYPITSVSTLANQLGTLAGSSPRTTTTTSPGPSLAGQVAGLGVAGAGINQLTGGAISSGVSSAYNSLFGSSSSGPFDASGSGSFTDAGTTASFDPSSWFSASARGGLVGYADGGVTADDGTYVPVDDGGPVGGSGTSYQGSGGPGDFSSWSRRATHPEQYSSPPAPPPTPRPAPPPVPGSYLGDSAGVSIPGLPAPSYADAPQTPPPPSPLMQGGAGDYDSNYAPQPAGPGAMANLNAAPPPGLAAGSPAVDQALATNPADIVNGNNPFAGAQASAEDSSYNPNDDDSLPIPTPPIPPSGGASRVSQSSDPSNPIPTGSVGQPSGGLSGQPGGQTGQTGQTGQPNDPTHNTEAMALLQAGLGMMASKSPFFLGSVGEGGLAATQYLQQQRKIDADAAYRQQLVGVRHEANDIRATDVDNRNNHNMANEQLSQQKIDAQNRRNDAYIAGVSSRIDKNNNTLTPTQYRQQLAKQYMQDHPDATPYEADNVITGVAARNSYLADRVGLARENLNNRENQQNTSNNLRQQSMQTRSDNARTNMAVQLFNNNPRRFKTIQDAKDFLDANPNMGGTPNLPMAQSETAPSAPATRPATPQEIASAQSVMARGASRQQVLEHAARNGITLPSGF